MSYDSNQWDNLPTDNTPRAIAFAAYNQAIEDVKAVILDTEVNDLYAAAVFINAIARKCSPYVYVNQHLSPVTNKI